MEGEGPKRGRGRRRAKSLFDARAPALLATHGAPSPAARLGKKGGGGTGRMGEGRTERRRGVLVVLVGWLFFLVLSAGFPPFSFPAYFARETGKRDKN